MIPFNRPLVIGNEQEHILKAIVSGKICGDGEYTRKCQQWFEEKLHCKKVLLTPSCTHALEMMAILLGIKEDDEVIMPSFNFVSAANAFVLRGAKIKFVDIRSDTMNIDEKLIEQAITNKTKAIIPMHYAGNSCHMDAIMDIAKKYDLFVLEDAAQGMMSNYKGRPLGTIGHMGTYSFHETKNYTSAGEGGLLIINDDRFIKRAEIIREKGTNRSLFFRGMIDKYSWVDIGSSYLLNDISAAYLWGQLEKVEEVNQKRLSIWHKYFDELNDLSMKGYIELPEVIEDCRHNAHIFFIKVQSLEIRTQLLEYLKQNGILAVFHYLPLHSSTAGLKFGVFNGADLNTTKESERLLRLPLYYDIQDSEVDKVLQTLKRFFKKNG